VSRDLTTNTKAQSVAAKRAPVWFAFFDFYAGAVYVWTGVGSISWDSQTWLGLGELASVSGLAESTETLAGEPTFTLRNADASLLALSLADNYNGRQVRVWRGFRDLATDAVVADPYAIFNGRMENIETDLAADGTCTIRVHAAPRNYAPDQADDRRYNDADQQIDFPGDTFFAKLASAGQRPIMWPGPDDSPAAGGGGSGGGGGGGTNYAY
jgi:hypothetical protein